MTSKTHFSYEVQYPAGTASTEAQRDAVMASLGPSLQALLRAQDSSADVSVSESHKGRDHKLVELVTTLQDVQLAQLLQTFSGQYGVTVTALE